MPDSPSNKALKKLEKDLLKEGKAEDKMIKKVMSELHSAEKTCDKLQKVSFESFCRASITPSSKTLVGQIAHKSGSILRKAESKEIDAARAVDKQNGIYRAAVSEHEKVLTDKRNAEQHAEASSV